MKRVIAATAVALLAVTALVANSGGSAMAGAGSGIRLNEMQVIGSHNSYHIEPPDLAPLIDQLAYTHVPLPEQFSNQGVRQIELDIFTDPAGTLWRPFGVPGYKVMHIEHVDEFATCETLVQCLSQVKGWSDDNDGHMPIAILLEAKDTIDIPGGSDPLPIGPAELDALDGEILSVFPEDRILRPDDVRGGNATLEEAVLDEGWPEIDDIRGKVMFLLDNKRNEYRVGHPTLEGRVAFTPSFAGQPDAAFVKRNDPLGANLAEIQNLVSAGYVVRTRADEPVFQAQANDTTMRDAALASGAQWVSTDFPVPGIAARWNGSTYVAQIPGGTPARCNPVNAPPGCESTDIENLGFVPIPASPNPGSSPAANGVASPSPALANPATSPRFTG